MHLIEMSKGGAFFLGGGALEVTQLDMDEKDRGTNERGSYCVRK